MCIRDRQVASVDFDLVRYFRATAFGRQPEPPLYPADGFGERWIDYESKAFAKVISYDDGIGGQLHGNVADPDRFFGGNNCAQTNLAYRLDQDFVEFVASTYSMCVAASLTMPKIFSGDALMLTSAE